MGSGFRSIAMQLPPVVLDKVRSAQEEWIRDNRLTTLVFGANFATATEPG